jgi:hypothetical protein
MGGHSDWRFNTREVRRAMQLFGKPFFAFVKGAAGNFPKNYP